MNPRKQRCQITHFTHGRVISSRYNCVGVVVHLYCDKTSLLTLLTLHGFLKFQEKEEVT